MKLREQDWARMSWHARLRASRRNVTSDSGPGLIVIARKGDLWHATNGVNRASSRHRHLVVSLVTRATGRGP